MVAEATAIRGIVKNGVVIPEGDISLPDGTRVDILLPKITPELQAEFDMWERASDEAWAMIDYWERTGFVTLDPSPNH